MMLPIELKIKFHK